MVTIGKGVLTLFPLILIIGPTATGKTNISVELALRLKGEIISGDSMQVYRLLDIGTAKIKPLEMRGIPHHLIDIKDPDDSFSAAEFQELARNKIAEIAHRGHISFLVGGTGLYIQSVIDNYDFTQQVDVSAYRRQLNDLARERGKDYVHQLLAVVDPISAGKIHTNDLKRVTRALEHFHTTGKAISEKNSAKTQPLRGKYNTVMIGLTMERHHLYQKIDDRVDQMMEEGFLEEVKNLQVLGYNPNLPSLQGLGYRQLMSHLNGEYDLQTAITLIKRDTRHFAKRQLTWFRRDPRIHWFHVDKYLNKEEIISEILTIIGRTIFS